MAYNGNHPRGSSRAHAAEVTSFRGGRARQPRVEARVEARVEPRGAGRSPISGAPTAAPPGEAEPEHGHQQPERPLRAGGDPAAAAVVAAGRVAALAARVGAG